MTTRTIALLAWLALTTSACLIYKPFDLGSLGAPGELRESVVLGDSGPKLVLVDLSGVISENEERGALSFGERPSMVAETRSALEQAADDDEVAGLLVRINSPGGTVTASETLLHELTRWKTEQKKPVVAFMNGLATSGGLYVAMAADRVIAHPTAVTGSIGVIMPSLSLEGLMTKYGVENQTVTSGRFKDTGTWMRDMRPDERAVMQSVVDDLYARFLEVVATGRPKLTPDAIRGLADGRIYSAKQAQAAGLVDSLGFIEDAVDELETRAGIAESRLVAYHRANRAVENVYSRSAPGGFEVRIEEAPLDRLAHSRLAFGFYYLWPAALAD